MPLCFAYPIPNFLPFLVAKLKPAVVLIPNFSKVTAQVIASLQKVLPETIYVGGDGWGDSRFGFVQNASEMDGTKGLTVRGFPSTDEGLRAFKIGRTLSASKDPSLAKPGSAAALAILKILDATADLLCNHRPKTALAFQSAFTKTGKKLYSSPWGVSIYQLKNGDISFERIVTGAT